MDCKKCKKLVTLDSEDALKCIICKDMMHNGCMPKKVNKSAMKMWKCVPCLEKPSLRGLSPLTISDKKQCTSVPDIPSRSSSPHPSNATYLTLDLLKKTLDDFKINIAGIVEDKLLHKCSELTSQNAAILEAINLMSTKYDSLLARVKNVEEKCTKIKQVEEKNVLLTKRISFLEEKLDLLDNQSMETEVEIRGLPEQPHENLMQAIVNISDTLDFALEQKDIISINRRTTNYNEKTKPVIVRFATKLKRNNFTSSASKFNRSFTKNSDKLNSSHLKIPGEIKPIYISEHLSQRTKYILAISRKFAKENSFAFCWCKDGRVFLKKQENSKTFRIRSEDMLVQLIQS